MMQGDTGCGEHSVCWVGGAGEDLGVREACRVVGQPWEETERGHQGNTMGECFDRTQRIGFLLDETC